MSRNQSRKSSQSVRSEFNASEEIGKSGDSFTRSFYIKELGDGKSVRNGSFGKGVSDQTIEKISKALGQIEQKIIPTKKITLDELSKNNPRAYDRFNSVFDDKNIGDSKVSKEFFESEISTQIDKQGNYRLPSQYIVQLANRVMTEAYLNNKRDFSNFSAYIFDTLSTSFGNKTSAQMVNLVLREGYNRMQRAGMTYQEKDPRNNN
jgi:hypothetical protein